MVTTDHDHGLDFDLDLVVPTTDHDSHETVVEQAVYAEGLGFAHVTMGETTGWNIVPLLSVIAERTDHIGITDDVLSPYARSPALLGQTALTLQDISGGRYRLGVGTSSPALTEQWHGKAFDRPLRRLRETIDIVRAVSAGGDVEYEGDIYEIGGLSYERAPPETLPPIDVAALGPKAAELTGRFADGWIPQLFTPDGLRTRLEDVAQGAALGDRDVTDLRVSPLVRCCAHEDREYARELVRKMVAFLIGAYGPFYGQSVAQQGYEDVVEEIRDAWSQRDTDAMAESLPETLLDELAVAGTPDEVRDRIKQFGDVDGVDAVRVGFVSSMTKQDKETTMEALVGQY
jgi:coenzyme F420-dependent oxidoreductase